MAPNLREKTYIRFCQCLIIFGILMKLYGVTDPWKRHDHYNFGGIVTSAYAECLKSTPLSVSKGVPHFLCGTDAPVYYRAHPPTILFALWGWTSIFGSAEWSYRLFIFLFSTLNIGLMFLIAREVAPVERRRLFPWLAAAFQAAFLGNMYFGTHLDFIGEFTVFFVLLMALAALRRRMTAAAAYALVAGISSWPGYIAFGPLFIFALLIRKGRKRVFVTGTFGLVLALGTMMWLHQTTDIVDFLRMKLVNPGYIRQREKGWTEPFRFALNFLQSQSRLLGPLFAVLAYFELLFGLGRDDARSALTWRDRPQPSLTWRDRPRPSLTWHDRPRPSLTWHDRLNDPFHHALLLSGGTGLLYALAGHEYFMVHVYLYLLLTPALALLAARFVDRALRAGSLADAVAWSGEAATGRPGTGAGAGSVVAARSGEAATGRPGTDTIAVARSREVVTSNRRWLTFLTILFAAVYPYGIFKTNAVHDALTSVALASAALALAWLVWRRKPGATPILTLLACGALANASQLINYRNEPDTERSFCEKARAEFTRTGQAVETHEDRSDAKDLVYCTGVPVRYLDANGKEQTRDSPAER